VAANRQHGGYFRWFGPTARAAPGSTEPLFLSLFLSPIPVGLGPGRILPRRAGGAEGGRWDVKIGKIGR
jgi:hypothetical protein